MKHMRVGSKTKKLLFIIVPVIAIFSVALLLWRPWYTPKPYSSLPPDPWARLQYAHSELQESQKLADSGKRSDLLDPQKALQSFLASDGADDLQAHFGTVQAQSIQDYGQDPKNGDRLFLVMPPRQSTFVFFRLRQLVGTGPTKTWSVIGYLVTSYSSSWQESDGPFISGQ